MRFAIILGLLFTCSCAFVLGKGGAPPMAHPQYRISKTPKSEFKAGGKTYKINPEAKSTKQIRALPSENFDPTTRHDRVDTFYRDALKDRQEELHRLPRHDSGPFRDEFVAWANHWSAADRARWAWHNRVHIDEALWANWMADSAFAAEIDELRRNNVPAELGYLPPKYASTSPVFVYNDRYLNAVYNPAPQLAVVALKSLKPDAKNDWIGAAAAESLVTKLSSIPGLFVAEPEQVTTALRSQKQSQPSVEAAEPAVQIGKALDVEHVVVGSYIVDGDKVMFNLRVVNVQTGAVQSAVSNTVARDHLLDAMPGLAKSLAAGLGYQSTNVDETLEAVTSKKTTPKIVELSDRQEDALVLGKFSKGTRLTLQYVSGKWKDWGRIATESPDADSPERGDECRVAIVNHPIHGQNTVLSLVPAGTAARAYEWVCPDDLERVTLRINSKRGDYQKHPGGVVRYKLTIQPEATRAETSK